MDSENPTAAPAVQQIFYSRKGRLGRRRPAKFRQLRIACNAMIDFFRKTSQRVLDFVFGATGPHAEALQIDSEAAWQHWLASGIEPDARPDRGPATQPPRT